MDHIETFINDKCLVDKTQKILSSKLYREYQVYIEIRYNINEYISNKFFTQWMRKNKPEFIIKRGIGGNEYHGLCLKDEYKISEVKSYGQQRERIHEYNKNYYQQNKTKILEQKKKKYTQVNDKIKEFIHRLNITPREYYLRKRNNLNIFVRNTDNSINWSETIRLSNEAVANYNQTINNLKQYQKDKEGINNEIIRLSLIPGSTQLIDMYNKLLKDCDQQEKRSNLNNSGDQSLINEALLLLNTKIPLIIYDTIDEETFKKFEDEGNTIIYEILDLLKDHKNNSQELPEIYKQQLENRIKEIDNEQNKAYEYLIELQHND